MRSSCMAKLDILYRMGRKHAFRVTEMLKIIVAGCDIINVGAITTTAATAGGKVGVEIGDFREGWSRFYCRRIAESKRMS